MDSGHKTFYYTKSVMDNLYRKMFEKREITNHYFSSKQNFETSESTFAKGARQLVVQLALETMSSSDLYSFSLTPTTNIGASLLGAEMITFFAPPWNDHTMKSIGNNLIPVP